MEISSAFLQALKVRKIERDGNTNKEINSISAFFTFFVR